MKTEILRATQELIDKMKGKLREADILEIQATSGKSADEALQYGLERSDFCFVLAVDGNPIAAFGVAPMSVLGKTGIPWLLATDELPRFTRQVVMYSRPIIQMMLDRYEMLTNWSDERNTLARRWLKWCGFVFDVAPQEYGVERRMFTQFFMERGKYV